MEFPWAQKLELLVALAWELQPADSAHVLENLAQPPVLTWAEAQSRARTSTTGWEELLIVGISTYDVSEGHWCSSSLQGRQQLVSPVDSQNIKASSPMKMRVEDALDYWKMKADAGAGLHTVIQETFYNALKGPSACSVCTAY